MDTGDFEDDGAGRRLVVLFLGDAAWHSGPGYYWIDDEYPDEGSCGAFPTADEAYTHAFRCGYEPNVYRVPAGQPPAGWCA